MRDPDRHPPASEKWTAGSVSVATDIDPIVDQTTLYESKNPTRRWLHASRREWVLDAVRRHSSKGGGRALEVGPGAGIYLPELASRYASVTAFDREHAFLHNAREIAEEYPNLEVVIGDMTQCEMTGEFDLILCTEVIEHVDRTGAALRELHRLMSPDGVLILTTPQRFSSLEVLQHIAYLPGVIQLVRWVYRESIWDDGHINLMTAREMRRRLAESGFRIIEEHKLGVYIPFLAEFSGKLGVNVARRLEPWLRSGILSWMLWTQCYVLRE